MRGKIPVFGSLALLFCMLGCSWASQQGYPVERLECPEAEEGDRSLWASVHYLTRPELNGRGTGTLGDLCAARFIAGHFAALGLTPLGAGGDFLQPVPWGPARLEPGTPGAWNVAALLKGQDDLKKVIILGAHHDHLGRKNVDPYFPGADDNASGVSAVLEVARRLSVGPVLNHSIVFVTFTGEEAMFVGSRRFLQTSPRSVKEASFMINLDMIGRMRDSELTVAGVGTLAESQAVIVQSSLEGSGLNLGIVDSIPGASDHIVFHQAGMPVLFLTTGTHSDHHRVSDTREKLDMFGIEAVAEVVVDLIRALDGGSRGPAG